MKEKAIEKTAPPKTKKKGWWTILQVVQGIAVLNIFNKGKLLRRHCFNPKNLEYETYHVDEGIWTMQKVSTAYGAEPNYGYYSYYSDYEDRTCMSDVDRYALTELLETAERGYHSQNVIRWMDELECDLLRTKRERAEQRRIERVNAMMERIPEEPKDLYRWIDEKETGGLNYCIKNRDTKKWCCSACGQEFDLKEKYRNNDMMQCPLCGHEIKYLSRKKRIEIRTHFCLIQPIDEEVSVARHYTADISFWPGQQKKVKMTEDVRVVLFKYNQFCQPKKTYDIYYEQNLPQWYSEEFDNKGNPAQKKEYAGYLYDGGIQEAFKNTQYEVWTRLFSQISKDRLKLNWNAMMAAVDDINYVNVAEMLYRGRFYRLLQEMSMSVSYWELKYNGQLNIVGESIEQVFGINDRQKINRIRDKNGGELMRSWMLYSEETGEKISDKALDWTEQNRIDSKALHWILGNMSLEQAMNYLERQKKESYPGKSIREVIGQYADYMWMCKKLKKKLGDEMIYKPRELKRRHDEAVEEVKVREAELNAEEYSNRYPEAEEVLQEIKEKFEYEGEQYFIIVPNRIYDIVCEGRDLHHCVGSTDRYFDRMAQHETYICFLRKKEEQDKAFYTIEVEPGGTIRQHRGMFDEEPELEQVKPFLQEWQKEIRKRMSKEDHLRAKKSKILREENIRELKEKNNTRVLNGLMEDFMEAEAV